MTVPSRPTSADHATHDRLLVAEATDRGGRLPADLAACPDCQVLHADLIALAAAVPLAAMPARLRDFQLTPADADRLRPAGWRRWLAAIGTSRDAVTRPLALGLTTLGLAGLLVATVPAALPFGGATAGAPDALETVGGAAVGDGAQRADSSAAPSGAAGVEAPAALASAAPVAPARDSMDMSATPDAEQAEPEGVFLGGDDPDTGGSASGAPGDTANATDALLGSADGSVPGLPVIAGGMLLAGLGLFALRRRARRV